MKKAKMHTSGGNRTGMITKQRSSRSVTTNNNRPVRTSGSANTNHKRLKFPR